MTPADVPTCPHGRPEEQCVRCLREKLEAAEQAKNGAYSERNQIVAFLARIAVGLGWKAGIGFHPASDTKWEADWRTIVFVDSPAGQLSWHFHDSEKHLLAGLPPYLEAWDGHSTEEKYARIRNYPVPSAEQDKARAVEAERRAHQTILDQLDWFRAQILRVAHDYEKRYPKGKAVQNIVCMVLEPLATALRSRAEIDVMVGPNGAES